MRVLVTGVKGQLGYDVMNELKKQGLTGIGVDVDEMDITDAEACRRVITEAKPDAVIHCAAYTAFPLTVPSTVGSQPVKLHPGSWFSAASGPFGVGSP